MKIYYAIEEELDVLENLTESQIEAIIETKSSGKEYVWSFKQGLFLQT